MYYPLIILRLCNHTGIISNSHRLFLRIINLYLVYTMCYQKKIFSVVLLFFFCSVFSQKYIEPDKIKQFNITVNYPDYTIKTQMLSQNREFAVNNERTYLWYASQKIMETKGGYDGRLIHGKYRSFYLNNQLKEQGLVRYGLKHGEWKYWYPDGKLNELIHWKKGVKNGRYHLYNDNGELMAKGHFKKDKLHGRFYTYGANGKIIEKKKYKNGTEVYSKTKKIKSKKEKVEKQKSEKPVKDKRRKKTKKDKQEDKTITS